jgi:ABC-2 type transport system permease protein
MSGLFTPLSSMPAWAQLLASLNPLKYFMQIMRAVYLRGSALADLTPQLASLLAFAFFFNGWAIMSYRKTR